MVRVARFLIGYVLIHMVSLVFFATEFGPVGDLLKSAQQDFPFGVFVGWFVIQQLIFIWLLWSVYQLVNQTTLSQLLDQYLADNPSPNRLNLIVRVLAWFGAYLLMNMALISLMIWWDISLPGMYGEQVVVTMLAELPLSTWYHQLVLVLLVVVIWPLVEELIWRAFITESLIHSRGKRGVVGGAALFAVAHFERGVIGNLFLLSLVLWRIYYQTRSLWYSYAFHVLINTIGLVVMMSSL